MMDKSRHETPISAPRMYASDIPHVLVLHSIFYDNVFRIQRASDQPKERPFLTPDVRQSALNDLSIRMTSRITVSDLHSPRPSEEHLDHGVHPALALLQPAGKHG